MIDEGRITHICVALDCRRTGRPRFEDRDFICTKCLGACDSALRAKHAGAASRLQQAQRNLVARKTDRNQDAVARAEFVESRAWGDLRRQVADRCGEKVQYSRRGA